MKNESFPLELAPQLVRDFVEIHQNYTEAPDEFLAISAIFAASTIAGKWVEFNKQPLNNYYLIIGPTGTAKKTTAQNIAIELLQEIKAINARLQYKYEKKIEDDVRPSGVDTAYPIVTHFTVEGLQSFAIGDGTNTAIKIGEYGSLFEIGKRQGQQNTISELTNMYDGSMLNVKNINRQIIAENYSISILGASTESWLGEFCSARNVGGGFVNRHIVVTGRPVRILPSPVRPPIKIWEDIVKRFSKLIPHDVHAEVSDGQIKWTGTKHVINWDSESEEVWKNYYTKRVEDLRTLKTTLLEELSARELTHATKLAGISAFLESRTEVNLKDLEFGIKLARWSVQNVISMMTMGSRPVCKVEERVKNKLKKSGPISKGDLARALGGNQKEINKSIGHMIIDGVLEDCPDGLLRLNPNISNYLQDEIEKYFGKSNICEFFKKIKLEVGSNYTVNNNKSKNVQALI